MIHGSTTPVENRDNLRTPRPIYDLACNIFLGGMNFDIDLAADSVNKLCPEYISEEENSLSVDWSEMGDDGFLNPPYSKIEPWIDKAIEQAHKGFMTCMLFPTPNGESYFPKVFQHANKLVYINGRVNFLNPDETKTKQNPRGSAFYLFGLDGIGDLRVSWVNRP